jgi:hypothetical protein
MFRATILSIIRCIRLYKAACGTNHPMSYQTAGRKLIGGFISQAAFYSLGLLMMGKILARNMSS